MIGSTNSIWAVNGKYEQLVNYTMLYDYGDECEDITGGWSRNFTAADSYYSGSKSKLTKNANNIKNASSVSFRQIYSLLTTNTIDTTGYSKTGVLLTTTHGSTSYTISEFRLTNGYTNYSTAGSMGVCKVYRENAVTNKILTGAISTSGKYYASFEVVGNGSPSDGFCTFYAAFLLKEDDWETLADKAGITATSIDDVLTNSETLLSNEKTVEFMIKQCTGDFMVSAIQNQTFLTALNNSPFKEKIMANEHWAKFLNMVN